MAKIKKLKNPETGQTEYPVTVAKAVFLSDGSKTVEEDLTQLGLKVDVLEAGGASPEFISGLMINWLDAHPEATTSVQNGSISYAKLSSDLQQKIDNMPQIEVEDTSGEPIEIYTKAECDSKFELKGQGGGGGGAIDKVKVNGTELSIASADKSVDIPSATSTSYGVVKIWTGTLTEYNAITTKDSSTFYCITE